MNRVIVTSSEDETMSAGEDLAREIREIKSDRSIVIFLEGELGAGKNNLHKRNS
jgi:tRNA A37 threonylcarbamoyladenosine biosynthesis protein TsaE